MTTERPSVIVGTALGERWEPTSRRSLLRAEDLQACTTLVAECDQHDPGAGWSSLDRHDVISNAPLLMRVLDERAFCAHCPGLDACCADSSSTHGTITKQLTLRANEEGVVRIVPFYAPCDLRRNRTLLNAATQKQQRRN
jgi:hypothetical protein